MDVTAGDPAASFWRGRRVFLTGHTGFKGSWLSLWLQSLGAEVHGFALAPPTSPALFDAADVASGMESTLGDVRDAGAVRDAMARARPEVVLHLAAQPLVRLSYAEPVETFATNVMGTVHVLDAARRTPGVRAIVNVTTDKCYENREWVWGYREDEPMGGHDPYSSSKGCSELATAAWRRSFFSGDAGPFLASARAGNVIGGGDWAVDRLVPDTLRAFDRAERVVLRHPDATRPWQHVLEPLRGYLLLAQRLADEGRAFAQAFNFGPAEDDAKPVRWIVERIAARWGGDAAWSLDAGDRVHEAGWLKLDASRAAHALGWRPRWPLPVALDRIVDWHRAWRAGTGARELCLDDIAAYTAATTRSTERDTVA